MVDRLPHNLQNHWVERAFDISSSGKQISFSDLSLFVSKRAGIAASTYRKALSKTILQNFAKPHDHPTRQRPSFATQATRNSTSSDPSVSREINSNLGAQENR